MEVVSLAYFLIMPSKKISFGAAANEVRNGFGADLYKEMERFLLAHEPYW